MASVPSLNADMAQPAVNGASYPHLPNEVLVEIFSHFQLPSAAEIGRARYESLNIPKGKLIKGPIKQYVDNELYTDACLHQHEGWSNTLRTVSAITKSSRLFRKLATPILYRIYPRQTLVKPQLFVRSLQECEGLASHVKELTIDAWRGFGRSDHAAELAKKLDFGTDLISRLDKLAKEPLDEEFVVILMLLCLDAEKLDITAPCGWGEKSPVSCFFARL